MWSLQRILSKLSKYCNMLDGTLGPQVHTRSYQYYHRESQRSDEIRVLFHVVSVWFFGTFFCSSSALLLFCSSALASCVVQSSGCSWSSSPGAFARGVWPGRITPEIPGADWIPNCSVPFRSCSTLFPKFSNGQERVVGIYSLCTAWCCWLSNDIGPKMSKASPEASRPRQVTRQSQ